VTEGVPAAALPFTAFTLIATEFVFGETYIDCRADVDVLMFGGTAIVKVAVAVALAAAVACGDGAVCGAVVADGTGGTDAVGTPPPPPHEARSTGSASAAPRLRDFNEFIVRSPLE
jgi:hypothetical protein